jgi:tRNA G37 N-methylase Trm5
MQVILDKNPRLCTVVNKVGAGQAGQGRQAAFCTPNPVSDAADKQRLLHPSPTNTPTLHTLYTHSLLAPLRAPHKRPAARTRSHCPFFSALFLSFFFSFFPSLQVASIQNEFRVFPMELLAGEAGTETEVRQHGTRFKLDFSKVSPS